MTWSTPPNFPPSTMVTSTQLNTLSACLLETAPAKATTNGSYMVVSAANTMSQRILGFDSIPTSETTSSTSYTNLATTGPTVTVTSGPRCLGLHTAKMANSSAGGQCYTAIQITGATSFSPIDNLALQFTSAIANASNQASYVVTYECSSGSNTFEMKYLVNVGTGTFLFRRLTILPY